MLLCAQAAASTARIYTLSADEWARPRGGDVIAEFSALRAAVHYWDRSENAIMVVRYPGEDSGELWAAELRDWLISLGVPSDYIRLVAGTQAADEIRVVVGNRDELEQ
ncbi:MAG: hypothetical protein GY875_19590 [Gammaproteobacteria bacterium]|nr:hypothetical protein [Gammaproteobacteria bacterium]